MKMLLKLLSVVFRPFESQSRKLVDFCIVDDGAAFQHTLSAGGGSDSDVSERMLHLHLPAVAMLLR